MRKLILILLIFLNTLYAKVDISSDNSVPIYKKIEVSAFINSIDEAIKNPQKFKQVDYFIRALRKKKTENSVWYKLQLYNSSNATIKREILTKWEHTKIFAYLVDENKNIITQEQLKKYDDFKLSNAFTIKAKQTLTLYLNVKTKNSIDDFYYLYITSDDNLNFIAQKQKFFNNGLLLGVLCTMMLYSFFMYLAIKIKSYLYLGLYQLAIVIHLSDIRYFLILLLQDYPEVSYWLFKILFSTFASIFSILFTKEFLNTKETMPTINKLLTALLILNIISETFSYYKVNYSGFLYGLYLVAGFISFRQGNKYALFFILGFTPTVIYFFMINATKFFSWDIYFEYQTISQILGVLVSFALSMALYLKLKQTIQEKEQAQKEAVEKEKMLLVQSRFATMGEMLASIAHQWKQPLTHLNVIFGNLLLANENKKLTQEYLERKHTEADKQLKYMADTITDFSNFFSTKKELDTFYLQEAYEETIELVSARIKKLKVDVKLTIIRDVQHTNYKTEFIQVLLVILNNALDALMLNNIQNKKIEVIIDGDFIHIQDNAGGIKKELMNKIFDAYFSTKGKNFGTGLGLYTAKIVAENIVKARIDVQNTKEGAKFTVTIRDIK